MDFKSLIKVAYKKSLNNNMIGIMYATISTIGFSSVTEDEIDDLVDRMPIDMLHLKSLLTDIEVDVYAWEFKNFVVKESEHTIYILTKNKEIPIMY